MTTARAIQNSVAHTAIGILCGSSVEVMMPAATASVSDATLAFEVFVQIALNGVLIAQVQPYLSPLGSTDPTYGLLFAQALFAAQPGLSVRIAALSALAKSQVAQSAQKMGAPVATAGPPNPHSEPSQSTSYQAM